MSSNHRRKRTGQAEVIATVPAQTTAPAVPEEVVLAAQLGVVVGLLAHRMRRPTLVAGITPTRLSALRVLADGPCRQSDLSARLGVSQASMSRLTATLQEQGWVSRDVDPTDRRAWLLTLTEQGARALGDVGRTGNLDLVAGVAALSRAGRGALAKALPILESLVHPSD